MKSNETNKPPIIATKSEKMVKIGSITIPAIYRGTARYLTGSSAIVSRASICSVTFIVPSSAAIAAPTRPATTIPVRTGPNSMITAFPTAVQRAGAADEQMHPVRQLCHPSRSTFQLRRVGGVCFKPLDPAGGPRLRPGQRKNTGVVGRRQQAFAERFAQSSCSP